MKLFSKLFQKRKKEVQIERLDYPVIKIAGVVPGKLVFIEPARDITSYESAQLCNLMFYLTNSRFSDSTKSFDARKFVEDHNLIRHFTEIK